MSEIVVFDTTGRTDYPPEALAHLAGLPVRLTGRDLPDEAALIACVTASAWTGLTWRRRPGGASPCAT